MSALRDSSVYFGDLVQTPDFVMIRIEMIHDVRLIPLDGRPHLSQNIRQLMGDSRGHWEGNTLVVDTTNFSDETDFRNAGRNMHLTERFTRVDFSTSSRLTIQPLLRVLGRELSR